MIPRSAFVLVVALSACGGVTTSTTADLGSPVVPADAAIAEVDLATSTPVDLSTADSAVKTGPHLLYASGYGADIVTFAIDASGALASSSSIAASTAAPSYLAFDPAQTHLYAVSEATPGAVAAYSIDASTGALTALNSVSSGGDGPAFLSVDPSGKYVLVANYGDGTVSVLPITSSGVGAATDTKTAGTNAHMMITDPSGTFVFVPCLGSNWVAQYTFAGGKLTANATPHLMLPAGTGPRHLAFAPDGTHAYLVGETASTISTLAFDATHGTLSLVESHSTLPPGYSGPSNTAAEVHVNPAGTFVYVSNRGANSITRFSIATDHTLAYAGTTPSGGATPRDFTIDASGTLLYVANEDGNNVVPFAIDSDGSLTAVGTAVTVPMASFVGTLQL